MPFRLPIILFVLMLLTLGACTGDSTTLSTEDPPALTSQLPEHLPIPFEPLDDNQRLFNPDLTGAEDIRYAKLDLNDPENMMPQHLLEPSYGSAFTASLRTGNRLMVYSAAVAAVELNPDSPFTGYELVMPALAEAIHLTGIRNLYVVSHNADLRNQIKSFCRNNGYIYQGAGSAIEAIKDLYHSSAHDLILIDAGLDATDITGTKAGENEEFPRIRHVAVGDRQLPRKALFARELFLQFKKDARTGHIPAVIRALPESNDDEIGLDTARSIYGDEAVAIISKPLSEPSLREITHEIFHRQDKLAKDAKSEAETLAIRACQAIADLRGKNTIYDSSVLADSLIKTFREPTSDRDTRIPTLRKAAMRAMQTVASQKALSPLMEVSRNPANDDSVRATALECLGTVYQANQGAISPNERNQLIGLLNDLLKEEADRVWSNAANTLGQINLTAEERTQLALDNRP